MNLIDKQNHIVCLLQLHHQRLHPLFKLTAILGTGHHRSDIQTHHALIEQNPTYFSLDDAKCQAFRDCRFTHTRFADQYGVVLLTSTQNLTHTLNFFFTAYDRIQLPFFCSLG